MKKILSGILGTLWVLAIHGCTDKEPAVERKQVESKQQETVFQGQIDALEKAKDVNQIIESHSAQQREIIEEQSQ